MSDHVTGKMTQAMRPFISVLIPAYNAESALQTCLAAVLGQSYQHIEVVVVDDGSTDGTALVLAELARRDSRLKFVRHANEGAGAARNRALSMARGTYVHFLDADDQIDSSIYVRLAPLVKQHSTADVVLFEFDEHNTQTGERQRYRLFEQTSEAGQIFDARAIRSKLLCSAVAPWNKLFKKKFLINSGIHFDSLPFANDQHFHVQAFLLAKQVLLLNDALLCYKMNQPQSLKGQAGLKRITSTLQAFDNILKTAEALAPTEQGLLFDRGMMNLFIEFSRSPKDERQKISNAIVNGITPHLNKWSDFEQRNWNGHWSIVKFLTKFHPQDHIKPIVIHIDEENAPYLEVTLASLCNHLPDKGLFPLFICNSNSPQRNLDKIKKWAEIYSFEFFLFDRVNSLINPDPDPDFKLDFSVFFDEIISIECGYIATAHTQYSATQSKKNSDMGSAFPINGCGFPFGEAAKPWTNPSMDGADLFWKRARETSGYASMVQSALKQKCRLLLVRLLHENALQTRAQNGF